MDRFSLKILFQYLRECGLCFVFFNPRVVSQQSWFRAFLFHKCSNFTPPPVLRQYSSSKFPSFYSPPPPHVFLKCLTSSKFPSFYPPPCFRADLTRKAWTLMLWTCYAVCVWVLVRKKSKPISEIESWVWISESYSGQEERTFCILLGKQTGERKKKCHTGRNIRALLLWWSVRLVQYLDSCWRRRGSNWWIRRWGWWYLRIGWGQWRWRGNRS